MTKRTTHLISLTALLLLLSLSAAAQNILIRGMCKDEAGERLREHTVEFKNLGNGQTVQVITGERGEYTTTDVQPGVYKISLLTSSKKVLFYFDRAELKPNSQYDIDFDLAKLKAEAQKQSGISEEQQKEHEKIQQENEKIRAINALLQQAAKQKQERQYAAALQTLQQAAAQDQTHDVVYGALGDAYMLNKKFSDAAIAYRNAIALAPTDSKPVASYHAGLGQALTQLGNTSDGMAECEKAAQLDSAQGGVCYFNQGAVLTNQGKPDAANEAFDKSIAADPTRADAYFQKAVNLLGKATLGSDNKMIPALGTVEAFNKYLELAPEGPYAQSAKNLLASLGAPVQSTYGKPSGNKK